MAFVDKIHTVNTSLDVRDFIHDDGTTSNNVISTMAYIPKFLTAGWPQAALNGLSVGGFWVDVYKNAQPTATSISVGSSAASTVASVTDLGLSHGTQYRG